MALPKDPVIYKSLRQVWNTLTSPALQECPTVRAVTNLCHEIGLVEKSKSIGQENEELNFFTSSSKSKRFPFIVIEGLDGTGKTTLTKFLSKKLRMKLMSTPPKNDYAFTSARNFFDEQPETIRRAYYSLGNYMAAMDVLKTTASEPVIMDRFWHSTAAYALAHQAKSGKSFQETDLIWPEDLLKPDLVIFLRVSEKERLRRHANRKNFTNTPEEQTLAEDEEFRGRLIEFYRRVKGPTMTELLVDGRYKDTEVNIIRAVLDKCPLLESRLTNESLKSALNL